MRGIYWIGDLDKSSLAIVARPRGDSWLEDDLSLLKNNGIDLVVSTSTREEAFAVGLEYEEELAERLGLAFRSYPIPDRTTPRDFSDFRRFILELIDLIKSGTKIGVHCLGCIGRSTVVTAAILIEQKVPANEALERIELARGCSVPDTEEQRDWIKDYARKISEDRAQLPS
jgi:protein-tyrosine phosphatase